MINIGIIGTGFGGRTHIPGFKKIRGVTVLGIAGKSKEKTLLIAKQHNIPLVFSSWKKLIAHPEIQAVCIVTPPKFHKEMAIFAAKNKKNIFCEKPLALSAREAKEMVKVANENKIIHMVDFEFRNILGLKEFKYFLIKNKIGNLRHINVGWLTGGQAGFNSKRGWQNDKKMGGGTLLAYGSHVLDYVEWLFGPISAVLGTLDLAKKNGSTAEDTCDLILKLKSGVVVNISISNVLPNGSGHFIEAYGDLGSLKLINKNPGDINSDFILSHFSLQSQKEIVIKTPISKRDRSASDSRLSMFLKTAENFISAIKVNKNQSPSFVDGLRTQVILDAIKKSNLEKRWIGIR